MKLILFSLIAILFVTSYSSAQSVDVSKIKTISAPKPVFPPEANNLIYGDAVEVQFVVDKTGKATKAVAYGPLAPCSNLEDKTAKAIAEAALRAAESTVFEPVLKDGQPIEMRLTTTYQLPVTNPPARETPGSVRKARYLAKPEYRASAKQAGIQGEVKILVLIDEQGEVLSAGPLSGHPALIAGAIGPSCKARFDKNPTKAIGIVTYRFVR
jgi:outer membrane biosynthesis protein TonB